MGKKAGGGKEGRGRLGGDTQPPPASLSGLQPGLGGLGGLRGRGDLNSFLVLNEADV